MWRRAQGVFSACIAPKIPRPVAPCESVAYALASASIFPPPTASARGVGSGPQRTAVARLAGRDRAPLPRQDRHGLNHGPHRQGEDLRLALAGALRRKRRRTVIPARKHASAREADSPRLEQRHQELATPLLSNQSKHRENEYRFWLTACARSPEGTFVRPAQGSPSQEGSGE